MVLYHLGCHYDRRRQEAKSWEKQCSHFHNSCPVSHFDSPGTLHAQVHNWRPGSYFSPGWNYHVTERLQIAQQFPFRSPKRHLASRQWILSLKRFYYTRQQPAEMPLLAPCETIAWCNSCQLFASRYDYYVYKLKFLISKGSYITWADELGYTNTFTY